jgi:hypothetical protein
MEIINTSQQKAAEASAWPTPQQMARLGAIGVCLGKDDGRFVESRKKASAHIFLGRQNENLEIDDDNGMRYSTHNFTGRVERTGYRLWSMRIAEAYWVRGNDDEDEEETNYDGYRTSYFFEWTNKEVLTAHRFMSVKSEKIYTDVLLDDAADIQSDPVLGHAAGQYAMLSGGDCELLMRDIKMFRDSTRQVLNYNR